MQEYKNNISYLNTILTLAVCQKYSTGYLSILTYVRFQIGSLY